MDTGSRSLGGLLGEPITRHAYPQTISRRGFQQLVDGDPNDKDPSHKPKDGDFTGPIQVGEMVWIILRRESLDPAVNGVSLKDEQVARRTYEMIYEVKLKETMGLIMQELIKAAAIENQLTGTVKLANEEKDPDYGVDGDVKLMSNPPRANRRPPKPRFGQRCPTSASKAAPPAGLSADAVASSRSSIGRRGRLRPPQIRHGSASSTALSMSARTDRERRHDPFERAGRGRDRTKLV